VLASKKNHGNIGIACITQYQKESTVNRLHQKRTKGKNWLLASRENDRGTTVKENPEGTSIAWVTLVASRDPYGNTAKALASSGEVPSHHVKKNSTMIS
jgi:hypothetical protein